MWSSIIKPTMVLFAVCIVVSGALAVVNNVTMDVIEERTKVEQEEFRKQVLEQADRFTQAADVDDLDNVTDVYAGFSGDDPVGYVMSVVSKGYGGDINMIVGVDMKGQVTKVIIGDNEETPGLGSKAKESEFIDQFSGVTVNDQLAVVKQNKKAANEIQALSGATITSRGVTEGIQAALRTAEILLEGGN